MSFRYVPNTHRFFTTDLNTLLSSAVVVALHLYRKHLASILEASKFLTTYVYVMLPIPFPCG